MALVLVAGGVALLGLARALYPYDLGHFEASVWAPATILARGENPYTPSVADHPPFVMAPYGPGYYLAVALGLVSFGPQLWFGRLVATASLFLGIACAARLTSNALGSRRAGALTALCVLASAPVQTWVGVHRPDALALALGAAGLLAAFGAAPSYARLVLAVACASGAFFTRQTTILPMALIGAWSITRGWRSTGLCAALMIGFVGVPTAYLEYASDGGYLWQQFVLPASLSWRLGTACRVLMRIGRSPVTWILAGACLVGILDACGGGPRYRRVVVAYLVGSSLLAFVPSGRPGTNVNYWLEPTFAASLVVPIALYRRDWSRAARVLWWALALGAVAGLAQNALAEQRRWAARGYFQEIVEVLGHGTLPDAPCLSVYPELATAANRPAYFGDATQYAGRSPDHHQLAMEWIQRGRLAALVLPYPRGPSGYIRVPISAPTPLEGPPAFLFLREAS